MQEAEVFNDAERVELHSLNASLYEVVLTGTVDKIEIATKDTVNNLRRVLRDVNGREGLHLEEEDISLVIVGWADEFKREILQGDVRPKDVATRIMRMFDGAVLRVAFRRRAKIFREAVGTQNVMEKFTAHGRIAEGPTTIPTPATAPVGATYVETPGTPDRPATPLSPSDDF